MPPSATPDNDNTPCAERREADQLLKCKTDCPDVLVSMADGCYVVRIGGAEKLRSDNRCLACRYLSNKLRLAVG